MRHVLLSIPLVLTLFVPVATRAAIHGVDLPSLALDAKGFPAASAITTQRIDQTAAAVDAEGIMGSTDTHGTTYQRLHFLGSVFQQALLPRFAGAARHAWLMSSVFPSTSAAAQAYGADSNFDTHCDASPTLPVAIPTQTCSYRNDKGQEAGSYAVGLVGNVEFVVLGFIEVSTGASAIQAQKDALFVARNEAKHIQSIVSGGATHAEVAPAASPITRQVPPTHSVPPVHPTPTGQPTSGDPLPDAVPDLLPASSKYEIVKTRIIRDDGVRRR